MTEEPRVPLDGADTPEVVDSGTDPSRAGRRSGRARSGADRLLVVAIIVVVLAIAGALVFVIREIPREGEAPSTAANAAISQARTAADAEPTDVYAQIQLADAYFQYGFYDDALATLDGARSLEPTATLGAYVEIGYARVYDAMGDAAKAEEHYLAALDFEESFDANYALGTIAAAAGDDAEALDYWLKAIALEPSAATLRVEIAAIYEAQGEYDLALAQLQEAVKYIPDDAEAVEALERVQSEVQ
ncbi:MAG: tetratricopeptide repeat protein [Coriobacteriia bacterium]|nr:tetratricopeptide repeat protein [Coriobacteriia bacterium]